MTHINGAPKGYIQYHPGGGRHGLMPYWKVSGGKVRGVYRADYYLGINPDWLWLL